MDPRDQLLQRQFPVHVAPRFGEFVRLATTGDRFVVTANGLVMETRRPWVYAVLPLQLDAPLRPVPFGAGPAPCFRLTCGKPPAEFGERFLAQARKALPNETAAWITWSDRTEKFRYREVVVLEHSPDHIRYERPDLDDGEHLVVDMHSHGRAPAFFSFTDESDDRGTLQLSCVVGNVDRDEPSQETAIRCLGITLPEAALQFGEL